MLAMPVHWSVQIQPLQLKFGMTIYISEKIWRGLLNDLWHHETGCGAWLVVTRDTVSHAVLLARLAKRDKK